jgi:carnitine 3-dehydrogenase
MVRPFIGGNFCQNWGAICAAAMGPTTLFHLGAGAGGLQAFCEHFADTFHGWWDELGHAKLYEDTIKILVDGIADAHGDASQADLSAARDALILAMQQATKPLR